MTDNALAVFESYKIRRHYDEQTEKDLLAGIYIPVKDDEFQSIAEAIAHRKKDAVLNIRINSKDLENIRQKSKKLGIKYQTFISKVLHKVAL
jgi:predicted DNA binding CopG/RHH family protein